MDVTGNTSSASRYG